MSKENVNTYKWLPIIIGILLLIALLYIISVGKIDFFKNEAFKENRKSVRSRHEKLKRLIEKRETLKNKLKKRFKILYFLARLVVVVASSFAFYFLIKLHYINDAGDLMLCIDIGLIILAGLGYLIFDKLSLSHFLVLLKQRIENMVWGRYINIDEDIEANKTEYSILTEKVKSYGKENPEG